MYSKSQQLSKWIQYHLRASNSRGHGIHSPFVYELIRQVFNDDRDYYAFTLIEKVRETLLQDDRNVLLKDMGAGLSGERSLSKKIKDIARRSLSTPRFGQLLFRLAHFYNAKHIVEMGSSLGISTAYLASASPASTIYTMEGSPEIYSVAYETFNKLKLKNIRQFNGHFDAELPVLLSSIPAPDLIFMDGNHRKQPVVDYFDTLLSKITTSSLIVIHDIHWSREMEEAWELIRSHPEVKMSIDIFSAGLVFFRDEFKIKQDFTIRF